MKIIIIQEKGRHKENYLFRESLSFQRAFNRIGVDTTVWGLGYDNFHINFDEIVKGHDVILLLENYDSGWLPNLSNYNQLKIFFSIDSHCILNQHINIVKNNKINIVLNAIDTHQIHFKQHCDKTVYFPNAYDSELIYRNPNINKIHDIGFCGSLLNRNDILNKIPNIKKDIFVLGDNMVNAINSYKIHFNRTLSNDINYRVFETLGCSTFLLTNNVENLGNLFEIDKHLVTYSCFDDLLDKITYYLKHNELRMEIALNGYNHVYRHHTYNVRANQLVQIINKF